MRALVFASVFCSACSAGGSIGRSVIDRSDDLDERPKWASVEASATVENGKMYFVGFAEVEGSLVSKSALFNVSDEKALSEPMRSMVSEFLDQNQVGESLNDHDMVSSRIVSATRGFRPAMPTLHIKKRFYETAIVNLPDGSFRFETKAFSLASVDVGDFENARQQMEAKLKGSSEVKKILQEVGAKQREKVLDYSVEVPVN